MKTINPTIIEKTAKTVVAIFVWSILALSFSCSSDEHAMENITSTYSIGGTITKSDGGAATDASIHLQNPADGSDLGITTTDASGAYVFSGIPAGVYKIVVTLNGYETATIADFDLKSNASGKDVVLQKIVVATYTISGTVSTSDGGIASGATLQLQTAADNTLVGQTVKTDANGAYTLTDIPAGTYKIIVTLDGYDAEVITGVEINSNVSGKNVVLQKTVLNPDAVIINFEGGVATVNNLPSNGSITASISGADVTIATSSLSFTEYVISGSTPNGSLKIQNNAVSANTLHLTLNNASISSASKLPPIQITKNEGITVVELKGMNNLSDNLSNEENATLISKSGSIEFEGYGSLKISGAAKHAIASSKKDITVRSGDIIVTSAASDGFHAEVGFTASGGSLNISASGDAIDAGSGTATINGGNITIVSAAADTKGMKGDAGVTVNGGAIAMKVSGAQSKGISSKKNVAITGGNITIETSGATVLETSGSGYDPSYCTAIKADGTITVSSGTITINSLKTANGGKGLSADGDITITGGNIRVTTAGDGAVYTNETGAKDSYSAACVKSNANISLLGGTITCNSSGTAGKGISADGTLTIGTTGASDNTLVITASTTGQKFLVSGSTSGGNGHPGGGGQDNSDYANPK
ncbi:MAG: carbohydrate-binding domain-containing protein, partial [Prevotella sp.]|nr:carbohydrate-binding domain-containing protein [Prevotella sp.]